jgi:hypothetical protein
MERRAHNRSLPGGTEQLGQNGYAALGLIGARGLVGAQQPLSAASSGPTFRYSSPASIFSFSLRLSDPGMSVLLSKPGLARQMRQSQRVSDASSL